jgi:hypothetical protein
MEAAEFLSGWAHDVRLQRWTIEPLEIADWTIALRDSGERRAEFREKYGPLLTFAELDQINQLEYYTQDPDLARRIKASTVKSRPRQSNAWNRFPVLNPQWPVKSGPG